MSTSTDNNKTRKLDGKDFPSNTLTYGDQSGQYPKQDYENSSSVNHSAKQSVSTNSLSVATSTAGADLTAHTGRIESQYPLNQVIETECGHVIEYNDTSGSERILVKHASGSGIDMRPDGSIIVNAQGNGLVEVVTGGHTMIVTGDGQITYSGNLTLNVTGDFNVNVGGSYNVQAKDETKTIKGPGRDLYYGSKYSTILGNKQETFTGNYTGAVLGAYDVFVKGDHKVASSGSTTYASKGVMTQSSEAQILQSSPDINIAAHSISVFGDTGTIGGENVIMYNYNMHTGHTVHAADTVSTPTVNTSRVNSTSVHASAMYATAFNGDLTGTADRSIGSAIFNASSSATGTNNPDDNKATALPTGAIMTEYFKGNFGIKKVDVDPGDHIKNAIDLAVATNFVTRQALTTSETRARKRDKNHHSNAQFNNYQTSTNRLNPKHTDTVPPAILDVRDPKNLTVAAQTVFPESDPTARVISSVNKKSPIVVDPQYDPNKFTSIIPSTKIAQGISFSQFIYGKGDTGKLDATLTLNQKIQILRNLYPQAQFLSRVRKDVDEFNGYNLEVVEGLYKKSDVETIETNGILDLRTKGRAVVYELTGIDGVIDREKTYELATWITKNIRFEKLIIDYDTYDPFGDLNVQIILIMPEIKKDWTATFAMNTETIYNGKSQGSEFLMISTDKNIPPTADEASVENPGNPVEDGPDEA